MVPHTGEVAAMVGGRDFAKSQFDRAVQAMRQPGSAFKPIIYAAALDWGISPAEVILDAPYIGTMESKDELWKPKNYKRKFTGPTLFRTALAESRNVVTVKILEKIGVSYCIQYAKKLGIGAPLSPDLSLALGSSGMTLRELTTAYSAFANGGMRCKPIFIRRVTDRDGRVLEEIGPELTEVISQQTAYVMTDLLKAVVNEGTGWRAKLLKRPAAGKTGTTNDLRDAWFIGYTPELLTGVWVGYDDRRAMGPGETGSRAANPIWLQFMSEALKGRPVADFGIPEGVVFALIDAETGLLAGPHSKEAVLQAFCEGEEPTEYTPDPRAAKPDQFLQFDMETSQ
jgi:penicillin-binding protein 1A